MKNSDYLLIIFLAIFPLICGFALGADYATPPIKSCELCEKCDTIEANSVKLIHNMCIIFDRHHLYDIDSSDEMSELLEASNNLSNLYNW
jgi:hypothetical protein